MGVGGRVGVLAGCHYGSGIFFWWLTYFYMVVLQRITGVNLAAAPPEVKKNLQQSEFFTYLCSRKMTK